MVLRLYGPRTGVVPFIKTQTNLNDFLLEKLGCGTLPELKVAVKDKFSRFDDFVDFIKTKGENCGDRLSYSCVFDCKRQQRRDICRNQRGLQPTYGKSKK